MKPFLDFLREPMSVATLVGLVIGYYLYILLDDWRKRLVERKKARDFRFEDYDEDTERMLFTEAVVVQGKKWRRRYLWWRRKAEQYHRMANEFAWRTEAAEVERDAARRKLAGARKEEEPCQEPSEVALDGSIERDAMENQETSG